MKIIVRGKHMEVTNALREYVHKRISKLEAHFFAPSEHEAFVVLTVEGDVHRAEVSLHVHGFIIRAEAKSADMYSSVDLVSDKLDHQLQKRKSKINGQSRHRGHRAPFDVTEALHSHQDDVNEEQVVKVKRFSMKPMDVQEAILQMELLEHDFYVFTNSEDEAVNVLYRRKSGNYGLIAQS